MVEVEFGASGRWGWRGGFGGGGGGRGEGTRIREGLFEEGEDVVECDLDDEEVFDIGVFAVGEAAGAGGLEVVAEAASALECEVEGADGDEEGELIEAGRAAGVSAAAERGDGGEGIGV